MNESHYTMNGTEIHPFLFEGEAVRVIDRDGDPWFVLADVCRVLGVRNSRDAAARLDDDEKGVGIFDTPGGRQEMTIISESGFYILVLRSHGATTPGTLHHRFRKWVTSEVLPAIRRTGSYSATPTPPHHPMASLALTPEEVRSYVSLVNAGRRTYGVRAAHFLWQQTPLPQIPHDMIDVTVRGLTADEVWGHCRTARSFDDAYWRLRTVGVGPQEAGAWAKWVMNCHEAQAQAKKSATARCGTAADAEDLF